MSACFDLPLMEGAPDRLLRPGAAFLRLPAPERVTLATTMLDVFQRLQAAHKAEPSFQAPIAELISWSAAGQDIDRGVQVWRLQLHRARQAARSAVAMGHGWPALPAGGPGTEVDQGVKTPYTPTAVPSRKESAN